MKLNKRGIGGTSPPNPSFSFGKRGMLDDLFDVLFTVMAAFFILLFMGIVIGGPAKAPEGNIGGLEKIEANSVLLNYLRTPISMVKDNYGDFGIEEGETFGDVVRRMKKVEGVVEQFEEGSGRWKTDVNGNFFVAATLEYLGDELEGIYVYDGETMEDYEKTFFEFDRSANPKVIFVSIKFPLKEGGERTFELAFKK